MDYFTYLCIQVINQLKLNTMGFIKTNYNTDSKLVLIDEERNVVAVINVPTGANITDSVMLAISDQLLAKDVVFEYDIEIGEFDFVKEIPFNYVDDEEEEFTTKYEVIKTAEY